VIFAMKEGPGAGSILSLIGRLDISGRFNEAASQVKPVSLPEAQTSIPYFLPAS